MGVDEFVGTWAGGGAMPAAAGGSLCRGIRAGTASVRQPAGPSISRRLRQLPRRHRRSKLTASTKADGPVAPPLWWG